ncbi:MAG: TetM/TetW/TetO/TetS family tetracycline resistance ribosomal protection protein [Bacteroidetes bacterium]|nr:TetM/TetW/TetO/TetS family tetracycline resistance ribosomal protection protein [Bacteroidota bacterium]
MYPEKKLTIGILAHVDAGKTSLTECLLFTSGATKNRGSVDKGSAITDGLALEKSRGISIKTATVDFVWQDTHINIVDTPGHIDFSAEVDRALSVLDLVILVVSAVEGVQAHTLNLWESIRERQLPVLVFMNKIDRIGADLEQVFIDFEKDLGAQLFALNYGDNSQPDAPKVVDFGNMHPYPSTPIIDKSLENLAELDEAFLEDYLEGNTHDLLEIFEKAKLQIQAQQLIGLLFGSAKINLGIQALLDQITTLFIPKSIPQDTPSAKVFRMEYDNKAGRLAYVRLYSGSLKNKDTIWSQRLEKTIKINQIFQRKLGKLEPIRQLAAGQIGMMTFSDLVLAGDVLGTSTFDEGFNTISQSVLSVQAVAESEKDYQKLGEAIEILNIEDPQLEFQWYKAEKEFQLKILGPIQTEVLKDSLANRFGISANFLPPKVIYKETPKQSTEGYVRYWMPKPCWAIMTFLIEPAPLGSGVNFTSKVRTSDVSMKYQNEVKRAVPWSLRQGIKGWEVTDINITLIEGEEHTVHSNPGDFLLATPMGILRGLELADTDLLEPMYAFQIKANQELLGAIASDLNQMNAQINPPTFDGDFFTLTGRVPVEKAMDYGIKFSATTSGKGRLKLTLDGYEKTLTTDEKIRPYKGVSPLDEAQWILHNRGAFKAEDRQR